jgi:hypothetical protein
MKTQVLVLSLLTGLIGFHAKAEPINFILHSEATIKGGCSGRFCSGPIFEHSFTVSGSGVASINLCDAAVDEVDNHLVDQVSKSNSFSLQGQCVELRDASGNILLRKENLRAETPIDLSGTGGEMPRTAAQVGSKNRNGDIASYKKNHVGDKRCDATIVKQVNTLKTAKTPQGVRFLMDPTHTYVRWDTAEKVDSPFNKCGSDICVTVKGSDKRDKWESWIIAEYNPKTCQVVKTTNVN